MTGNGELENHIRDVSLSVSKLFGAFFPTLFGVSYSGVEAPAARTQRRAGDPTSPQVRRIPWKIGRHLSWKMTLWGVTLGDFLVDILRMPFACLYFVDGTALKSCIPWERSPRFKYSPTGGPLPILTEIGHAFGIEIGLACVNRVDSQLELNL
jgi:hypothetical protein